MTQPRAVRFLLGVAALLMCTAGCSCSSHIPESPPGEGPIGEIKNLQTGEVISGSAPSAPTSSTPSSSPNYSQPAATNFNRP
jgi:hypothetical protein